MPHVCRDDRGLLADATGQLRTPYIAFLVLLVLSIVAVDLAPETVDKNVVYPAYRPHFPVANHGVLRNLQQDHPGCHMCSYLRMETTDWIPKGR